MANLTIPYGYAPRFYQENILKALDSGIKNACWVVHRRGGKDTTMWNYMIKRAYMEPGIYYYLLPTYAQAKRVIWDGMTNDGKKMIDYIPKEIIDGQPNNTEMKVWIKGPNGNSLIQLIGADAYDSIMGTNPRGIVFSEWSLMDPMVYEFVKPILAANGGWCAFIYTPRGKNHGWDLAEIARKNPNQWFYEVLTVKQTNVLSEDQIEDERLKGMSEDLLQQEFYCNFNRGQEGSYYGSQMETLRKKGQICRVPFDPSIPVRTYWDLGIGDSTAIFFAQFVNKEIHLVNYYENSGEGLAHYARILDDYRRASGCIYDLHVAPHDIQARELSTGQTRLESARRLGLNFRVAPKLSLESGIESVRMILSRCWFDEIQCDQGIKCLENYRKEYNEKYKVYSDRPKHDWSSHGCLVAGSLILTPKGFKKIEDMNIQDYVITPLGKRKVLWAGETKKTKKLMEITTSRGNKLICTENHKVFVHGKGFTRCDELRYNDVLSSKNIVERLVWKLKSIGMGISTNFKETFGYQRTNQKLCTEDISTVGMEIITDVEEDKDSILIVQFIVRYGLSIMEKFRKNITFITKMATKKITKSLIWNLLMPKNMLCFIQVSANGSEVKKIRNNLELTMTKLNYGIHQKKELNGIVCMEKNHGQKEFHVQKNASFVTKILKLFSPIEQNIVQQYVSKNIQKEILLKKNLGIAQFATLFLKFISMLKRERVVSLVQLRPQDTQSVYDLTIQSDGCYYAQGFLVSNSDAFRMLAVTESSFRPDQGVGDIQYELMKQQWGWRA